jgi:hypothetical protein
MGNAIRSGRSEGDSADDRPVLWRLRRTNAAAVSASAHHSDDAFVMFAAERDGECELGPQRELGRGASEKRRSPEAVNGASRRVPAGARSVRVSEWGRRVGGTRLFLLSPRNPHETSSGGGREVPLFHSPTLPHRLFLLRARPTPDAPQSPLLLPGGVCGLARSTPHAPCVPRSPVRRHVPHLAHSSPACHQSSTH